MKILLTQYSAYNLWANQQFIDFIEKQPVEIQNQKVENSFPSLCLTLLHMWDAESIWWQRIKLSESIQRPSDTFSGSFSQVSQGLKMQSKQWHDWILGSHEHMFDHEFIYYTSKKEKYKQPVCQVLLHIFNHATYHRGQLVTMLRQLEVGNIPTTDFAFWSRKKSII
jgi:uncharacterized damage-inducible protein DinB